MQRTSLFNRSGGQDSAAVDIDATPANGLEPPAESEASRALRQPAPPAGQTPATSSPSRRSASGAASGPTLMQRIKDKGMILEYANKLTKMKQSPSKATEYFGKCPDTGHDDSRASFCVNTEKQAFHCKGCGIAGNVVSLYGMIHGLSDEDAKFALGRELGVMHERRLDDAESILSKASGRYIWQLANKKDALKYLKDERGLTDETIAKFGIGFCWGSEFKEATPEQRKLALETGLARLTNPEDPSSQLKSFMAGRITFPVKDRSGRVVGYAGRLVPSGFKSNGPKYINSPETPWFRKSELLYGAHEANSGIAKSGYAAVVEGYMDVVALHQTGVDNAVAVMGASANETTFQTLWAMTKRIVFCLDGDAAGESGAMRSVLAAAPTMEDGCEIAIARLSAGVDPDEFVLEHGADAFRALCDRATPLARFLMESRSHNHDLSYPEGRARFMADAREVAGIFAKAPIVREQIVAEARAINAASLVQVALDITGVAEDVSPQELRDAIALMQRRLATLEAKPAAAPQTKAADAATAPAAQSARPAMRPR